MDVEALLAPVSDESVAGQDFDGTSERYAIEEPFQLDAGGGETESLDWRGAVRLIVEQSKQTKDLWLATYLARAGAKAGDLETVVGGAQMLAGLLERYWPEVHPSLEDVDFIGRKAPCESLTRIREFLGPLRRTVLIAHPRLGSYSGQDFERFASEGEGADGYGMFRAALAETAREDIQAAVDRLDQIRDAIRRSDAVLVAHAGGETGTNFQPTYETIEAIRRSIIPYAGLEAEEATSDDAGGAGAAPAGAAAGARIGGKVESREDVIKAIDAIADYYRVREPGSPVPVLLKRARNWVTLDFLAVIDDLVPDSSIEARRILVSKSDQDAQSGYSGY